MIKPDKVVQCERCEGMIAYRRDIDTRELKRDQWLNSDSCRCHPGDERPFRSAVDRLAELGKFLPTEADIGRGVVYQSHPGAPYEDGVITSLNASVVFVRYADQHPGACGRATPYNKLTWLYDPSSK